MTEETRLVCNIIRPENDEDTFSELWFPAFIQLLQELWNC